jgi:hypothetical protein
MLENLVLMFLFLVCFVAREFGFDVSVFGVFCCFAAYDKKSLMS